MLCEGGFLGIITCQMEDALDQQEDEASMASILARVKSQRLCLWTKTPSSTSLMTFQVIIEQLEI